MSVEERLIRYCSIDTQSDPSSGTHPSSMKQFNLANMLVDELLELGLTDAHVDSYCYVYAHLEANCETQSRTVGFVAHMDTSPDYSGKDVKPRIIRNYDGNDIVLSEGVVTAVKDYPYLASCKGKTIMVTDGSTLLGADDKAGIAAIMDALEYYAAHPEVKHGRIAVAFTPDEEIGEGADHFNYQEMNADFAYTMDGGAVHIMSDETFNAASAVVTVEGLSIHPGSAKNRMINAGEIACRFQSLLPEAMTPEHTEGREGFIHLHGIAGDVVSAKLTYIIRDHDDEKFEEKKNLIRSAVSYLNAYYNREIVHAVITDSYYNMKKVLKDHPEVSQIAWGCMEELGLIPENEPIRGGTDGSRFSFEGLPCPNLGCGGGNFHGRYEYCVLEELEVSVELIKNITKKVMEVK